MTWSILARDADDRFGVAIASRFFAVGALCVHTRRGVGALATQARMNPLYGPAGLSLRVDDHAEPIVELQRLYRVSLQRYQPFMACLAGRHDPVGLTDRSEIEARIEAFRATPAAHQS